MHIALVSQEYPPGKHGGIGAQNKCKAEGLIALGHSVTVVTHEISDHGKEPSDGKARMIRVPGYDDRLPVFTEPARWITYSVRVAEALAQLHENDPLDLIDFAEWGAEGYTFFLNRTEYNYVPAVIQLHGPLVMFAQTMNWPEPESALFRVGTQMESTCVQLADAVCSSSQCSLDWCVNHYGLNPKDVPIIHTGIDPGHFRPCAAKERRPTIVFAGKLVENKGVFELAQAALNLLDEFPDLQVWMVGRGESSVIERLQTIADGVPSHDFLQLLGFRSRKELPELFSRAHVFAAPSIYEGGPGFVYLEAMGCGLPVIACSGSGASEVITPEKTGFLVPPRDVAALTDVLRRLLADVDLREATGKRAREYVLAEADSQVCIERLVRFYESVIARHERRSSLC
jgi:glycosyltransferase involved in cell wall biosynthesis